MSTEYNYLIEETDRQALIERAEKHGVSVEVLEEVFNRGIVVWVAESLKTPEQYAFNRVDSFIANGFASKLDWDLKLPVDISSAGINEGKKINSKVEYQVVHRDTHKVIRKHTQKHKAMYQAKKTKHAINTVRGGEIVHRQDHNGRKLDDKGRISESEHYIAARQQIHDAHAEVSRQLAGRERDPELRRIDLHRSKKHAHASRVLEIIKTRNAKK